jgi:aryl-alcohol dehydrogenase-like predicted oxidoreductase
MRYLKNELGGKKVSVVGLGTMIFSPEKKELCFKLLNDFVDNGGTFVDTAEIYGDPEEHGYSEIAIGMWLKETGRREDIVLMSKGCIPDTCSPIYENTAEISKNGILNAIDGSLERLQTDYLDMWMLHRDDESVPVKDIVDTLNDEIKKGKIRNYGGSNWNVARIKEANEYAKENNLVGMLASSPQFSLPVAKEPYWPNTVVTSKEDKKWFEENEFPLIAWSALGRGFLAKGDPEFKGDPELERVFYNDENFERKARAKKLGEVKGLNDIEIALAYVVNQKFPVIALMGPESKEQLLSCIKATDLILSQEELDYLELKTEKING